MKTRMAKRTTNQWLRRSPKRFCVVLLSVGFWVAAGSASLVRAADSAPSGSPAANVETVAAELAYQETGKSIMDRSVSLKTQTAPFSKEPAVVSGKAVRGVLNFGDNSSNSISFVWQRDARKLFLDLNRDGNLTNDAAGVFSAESANPVNYQTFTNIHLSFGTAGAAAGRCQVLIDFNLYDYSTQPSGILRVRSFWQGRVTLSGRDWQVGLVPNDSKVSVSFENCQLLLRPWEERNRPFTVSDGTLATVSFSPNLFLDGHSYHLEVKAQSGNSGASPALRFMEQPVVMGDINISGKFIQRLVLTGGPYLVVLDQPSGALKMPIGDYNQPNLLLAQGGVEAYNNSSQPIAAGRVSVNSNTPVVLNVGGPLTNSVTVTRSGQDLRLDYRLIGQGGAAYQFVQRDTSKPPEFAIFKGDRKIASGKFEFG